MNPYVIWWQPQNQSQLLTLCPSINTSNAVYNSPVSPWVNGYYRLEQDFDDADFGIIDDAANSYVAIDIKPAPYPPGNPLGR